MAKQEKTKDLPANFVGYFGTQGHSGHNLYVLDGCNDVSTLDVQYWAGEFDEDWILLKLSTISIKVFYWDTADVTICGYPRSVDDKRPGSKSLFILKGNHISDSKYIIAKMKQYPWIYDIFEKLTNEYIKD